MNRRLLRFASAAAGRCATALATLCRLLRDFVASPGGRSIGALGGTLAIARFHLRQRRPDRHLVVDGGDQLGDDPVCRSRHLGVDLVRRHLDHGVALGDEIALGDVPLENDALRDRLAHLGHLDLNGRRLRHHSNECMKEG
jgi:hypothetical protein